MEWALWIYAERRGKVNRDAPRCTAAAAHTPTTIQIAVLASFSFLAALLTSKEYRNDMGARNAAACLTE